MHSIIVYHCPNQPGGHAGFPHVLAHYLNHSTTYLRAVSHPIPDKTNAVLQIEQGLVLTKGIKYIGDEDKLAWVELNNAGV